MILGPPPQRDVFDWIWKKWLNSAFSAISQIYPNTVTAFTTADATPTVKDKYVFKTVGTTPITDFDDGVLGQTIQILATDSITITDGAPIILNGSADYTMTDTDTLTLTMFNDQVWQEVARSVN